MIRWMAPALLLIAGCASMPSADAAPCRAAKAVRFVGQAYTPALGETLRRRAGAKSLRAIGPDTMTTRDYRIDRLNVTIDAKGQITGANCG